MVYVISTLGPTKAMASQNSTSNTNGTATTHNVTAVLRLTRFSSRSTCSLSGIQDSNDGREEIKRSSPCLDGELAGWDHARVQWTATITVSGYRVLADSTVEQIPGLSARVAEHLRAHGGFQSLTESYSEEFFQGEATLEAIDKGEAERTFHHSANAALDEAGRVLPEGWEEGFAFSIGVANITPSDETPGGPS